MHVKHVLCVRILLRTLQAGIKNNNPLIKDLSRLLRKNVDSIMRVSTVLYSKGTSLHCFCYWKVEGEPEKWGAPRDGSKGEAGSWFLNGNISYSKQS